MFKWANGLAGRPESVFLARTRTQKPNPIVSLQFTERSCTHIFLLGATQHTNGGIKALDAGHLRKTEWGQLKSAIGKQLKQKSCKGNETAGGGERHGKKGKAIEKTTLVICSERLLFCAPFSFHFGQLSRWHPCLLSRFVDSGRTSDWARMCARAPESRCSTFSPQLSLSNWPSLTFFAMPRNLSLNKFSLSPPQRLKSFYLFSHEW